MNLKEKMKAIQSLNDAAWALFRLKNAGAIEYPEYKSGIDGISQAVSKFWPGEINSALLSDEDGWVGFAEVRWPE